NISSKAPCSNENGFQLRRLLPGSVWTCAFNRYFASVGTSVRDSRYDAIIAKTTASASGTNKYFATPVRKNIGTNTMQIDNVDTKAGMEICWAPSRMARSVSLP